MAGDVLHSLVLENTDIVLVSKSVQNRLWKCFFSFSTRNVLASSLKFCKFQIYQTLLSYVFAVGQTSFQLLYHFLHKCTILERLWHRPMENLPEPDEYKYIKINKKGLDLKETQGQPEAVR